MPSPHRGLSLVGSLACLLTFGGPAAAQAPNPDFLEPLRDTTLTWQATDGTTLAPRIRVYASEADDSQTRPLTVLMDDLGTDRRTVEAAATDLAEEISRLLSHERTMLNYVVRFTPVVEGGEEGGTVLLKGAFVQTTRRVRQRVRTRRGRRRTVTRTVPGPVTGPNWTAITPAQMLTLTSGAYVPLAVGPLPLTPPEPVVPDSTMTP